MSHPPRDPSPDIAHAHAPHGAAPSDFNDHRYLLSHAIFTIVLLVALTAMVTWLLLTRGG